MSGRHTVFTVCTIRTVKLAGCFRLCESGVNHRLNIIIGKVRNYLELSYIAVHRKIRNDIGFGENIIHHEYRCFVINTN